MATISELDASVYARFAKSRGIISWGLLEFPRYSLKLEVSEGIPDFLRGAIRASIWLFVRRKLVVPSVKSFKIKLKKNDGTAAEKKTDAVADDPGTLVLIENKKSILTKVTSKLRNRFSPVANYGRNSPDKLQPMTLGDDTNTVITNTEAAEDVTAFARELCEGIIERAIERIE